MIKVYYIQCGFGLRLYVIYVILIPFKFKLSIKMNKHRSRQRASNQPSQIIENPTPQENPTFDFKDLSTLQNHWLKMKGKLLDGKKEGICLIYLINGDRIYCKFENDVANGKGIYFKKSGEKVLCKWKKNRYKKMS